MVVQHEHNEVLVYINLFFVGAASSYDLLELPVLHVGMGILEYWLGDSELLVLQLLDRVAFGHAIPNVILVNVRFIKVNHEELQSLLVLNDEKQVVCLGYVGLLEHYVFVLRDLDSINQVLLVGIDDENVILDT